MIGYLVGVWRFDRGDDATDEAVPKLNIQVCADRDYVIQTGFTTNFARTFLAGLLGLDLDALKEPLTLVLEDNAGSRARPTVFCRVESRGQRMTPTLTRNVKPELLYDEVLEVALYSRVVQAQEVEGVGVFKCLPGKFGLRRGQRAAEVVQGLTLTFM